MKKILYTLATIFVILPLFFAACKTVAPGPVITRQLDYSGFTNVQAGSAFQVELTPSDIYSVSVTAPQNWFDHLKVEKDGGTLKVNFSWEFWDFVHNWNSKPALDISMPEISILDLSGASTCSAKGFSSEKDFKLNLSGASTADIDIAAYNTSLAISGASHLHGNLNANDVRLNLSGASQAVINGSLNDLNLQCSGASHATLNNFPAQNTRAELSGASQAYISSSGTLDIYLSGASTLEYSGKPYIGKLEISGASRVQQK